MKRLYMIGGPMGVGKTAACRQLQQLLDRSVFLDGDWCWDAHPFQVTEETRETVSYTHLDVYKRQSLSFALILDLICCNIVLKPLVGRVRPFLVNTAVELLTAPPADASFPSGHTAASFAAVFALRASGSPLWKPALVLAAGIAFSRLYLYVHWPTDVLGGILVGAAAGWAGARLADALRRRRERLGRRA